MKLINISFLTMKEINNLNVNIVAITFLKNGKIDQYFISIHERDNPHYFKHCGYNFSQKRNHDISSFNDTFL